MKPKVYIGPAGWSYPDWNGVVYPTTRTRVFDPLEYLASYFNLIEINSTFYRIPSPRVTQTWTRRVSMSDDFRFTVKAHGDMTHHRVPASQNEVSEFKKAIDPLFEDGRLGAVLIQFPWSFRMSPDTQTYVQELTRWFSPLPTAVEVRHGSWGSDRATAFFRDNEIALCGIDQPRIGNSIGPSSFVPGGSQAYFRLHGRNKENWFDKEAGRDARYDYLYSKQELSFWRTQIEEVSKGVERLFVVLNNHFRGQAVANALQLRAMLTGRKHAAPPELIAAYPQLGDALRPARRVARPKTDQQGGQLGLFDDQDQNEQTDDTEQNR
ncbi:MAG: DUF72 domain-containing protein [Candidatus Latescibacterota bacterium]|nr:MAG: DUF72 domain-containing protein [Candidatus Latescibacterota bacterium]